MEQRESGKNSVHFVVIHDKGETRVMSPRETPRERMARVVQTIQKKQKTKRD